jgi:hypothetical protein
MIRCCFDKIYENCVYNETLADNQIAGAKWQFENDFPSCVGILPLRRTQQFSKQFSNSRQSFEIADK